VGTGRLLLDVGGLDFVTGMTFSPDGRRLAAVNAQSPFAPVRAAVWELEPGRGLYRLRGLVGQVAQVRFAPDGRLLAALSHDWQVAAWDTQAGRLLHVLDAPKGDTADNAALAISPDGSRLACATGQEARLWEIGSGRQLCSWPLPPGYADAMTFDPSGQKLLLFRVEPATGEWGPPEQVPRLCRVRDLLGREPLTPLHQWPDFSRGVFNVVLAPDGGAVVVEGRGGPEGRDRAVTAFDVETGRRLWSKPLEKTFEFAILARDPSGRFLAFAPSNENRSVLADLATGRELDSWGYWPGTLGPGARYSLMVDQYPSDGCRLHRGAESTPLLTLGIDSLVTSVRFEFSADGDRLAWGSADGVVTVCDLAEVRRRLAEVGLGW
jgi:WD40 repeat protein